MNCIENWHNKINKIIRNSLVSINLVGIIFRINKTKLLKKNPSLTFNK